MWLNTLFKSLKEECAIGPSQPILFGFSGGPDSLALLHALKSQSFAVIAAHFDHGLRPESAEDARRAERLAANLDSQFFTERGDVTGYAETTKLSMEEAARELRYRFLFGLAKQHGAQAVMVAHHADDQVETVLMHLLRGAGPAGLRGMAPRLLPNPWSQTIPLTRPMLSIWRQEIEQYCRDNQLDPIQDASNQETTYFRNQLRGEVIPFLETVSPGLKARLHNSAEILKGDYALLKSLTRVAWTDCLSESGKGFLGLNRMVFLDQPVALQRSLFRRALAELRPAQRDLDFDAVERALHAIKNLTGTATDWFAGLYLLVEEDRIWIADWESELPVIWPEVSERVQHLEVPGSAQLNSPWKLTLDPINNAAESLHKNSDGYQAWLDLDTVGEELALRRRRPGDRFQPLGLARGSLKLSDFMINEKMPPRARAGWPLLCKGDEIVWVPGYRLAHPYRLRPESRRTLHVQLVKT
ncbi:MAG: tRNA lysidine(34) synthetase TilS [Anaerolineales bacterium]